MRRIRVRAAARADILEIMEYIAADSPRSSRRFPWAIEKLAKRLAEFPELGALYDSVEADFAGLRVFSVPRFRKYLVFYRVEDDVIDIIRVIHGARDLPTILESET